jgi:hypothetical protein
VPASTFFTDCFFNPLDPLISFSFSLAGIDK